MNKRERERFAEAARQQAETPRPLIDPDKIIISEGDVWRGDDWKGFLSNEGQINYFNWLINYIEGAFGLRLSVIELNHLKRIAKEVALECYHNRDNNRNYQIDLFDESIERFFRQVYDIDDFNLLKDLRDKANLQALREYLRRQQQRMHNPGEDNEEID